MNKAVKRRAIICSLLTIALCISLVAGVSFALFHGTAGGSVQISAGKISLSATIDSNSIVSQKDDDGEDVITARVDTKDGSKLIIENASSGYSVNFNIKVNNESTIPVKYRIIFSGNGNLTLFDAMQIKINSETKTKTSYKRLSKEVDDEVNVSVYFEEFNEGASCELSYRIEAVQANASVETESSIISVRTPHEFIWALDEALAESGKTIKLIDDIDLRGSLPRSAAGGNVKINGNGKVITLDNSLFEELNGGSYTFENITFNNPEAQAASRVALMSVRKVVDSGDSSCSGAIAGAINDGANVVINGCTVKDRNFKGKSAGAFVGSVGEGSTVTFKGCSVENSEVKGNDTEGASTGYFVGKTQGVITFDNCSVDENSRVEKENADSNNYVGSVEASSGGEGETGAGKLPDVKVALAEGVYINNGIYEISSAKGFVDWFVNEVNVNGNDFANKTVKLVSDIDLTGKTFNGVGRKHVNAYVFCGTFDGDYHTIKGININNKCPDTDGDGKWINGCHNGCVSDWDCCAGLFTNLGGTDDVVGTVKNVTIVGAKIVGTHYTGGIVGYAQDRMAIIENCHVIDSEIKSYAVTMNGETDCGDKAGGIVGYLGCNNTVDGCSVENVTVTAYRDIGAIAGFANTSATVKNCIIKDGVVLVVDNSKNYKNITDCEGYYAGNHENGVVGRIDEADIDTVTLENNRGSVESIYEVISEGIILNYRTSEYEISNANGWVAFAKMANENAFGNIRTINLVSDIDLTGVKDVEIKGLNAKEGFTINGNNRCITGLKTSLVSVVDISNAPATELVIKNVTVSNFAIDGTDNKVDAIGYGAIIGDINNTNGGSVTIENCTAENGSIKAWKYAGGLIGHAWAVDAKLTITNCSVKNVIISAEDSSVGGFIGQSYAELTISGGEASDLIVSCEEDRAADAPNNDAKAGKLIGSLVDGTATISGTRVSNVELGNINAKTSIYEGCVGRILNDSELIIGGKKILADGLAVDAEGILEVSNANGLMALLSKTGIKKIAFVKDIDMTGKAWTSFFGRDEGGVNNFDENGVTISGNGHSISNLCAPLISESMTDVTIEGLTIKDSTAMAQTTGRVDSEKQGFGAFIQVLNSRILTLKDCHLVDSKLITTDDTRVGGFAGIIWGDANISNCTVEGCELSACGAVGGIVAQSGDMDGKTVEISNCTVKETTLNSIDNDDWRVGAIVGSANNCTTLIIGCTSLDNTLTQIGKTAPDHELYGRIRNGGTLKIDGKTI